jgi:hypothetical protein
MVTLVALLSWEVGDGFLTCSGNYSRDIFPSLRFGEAPSTKLGEYEDKGMGRGS